MVAHAGTPAVPGTSAAPAAAMSLLSTAAEQALSALLPDTAIFLAERLVSLAPSPASASLLARAHIAAASPARAAAALAPYARQPSAADEVRYLYAAALVMGGGEESMAGAEAVLRGRESGRERDKEGEGKEWSETLGDPPGGAAGCFLLGRICQRRGKKEEAVRLFRRALALNPILWGAADALAGMGMVQSASSVVGVQGDDDVLALVAEQPGFHAFCRGEVFHAKGGDGKTVFDTSAVLATENVPVTSVEIETPVRGGATAPPCTPAAATGQARRPRGRYSTPSPAPAGTTPAVPGAPMRKAGGGGPGGGGGGGIASTRAAAARAAKAGGGGGGGGTPARVGGCGSANGAADVRRSARLFATPDNREASAVSRVLGASAPAGTPQPVTNLRGGGSGSFGFNLGTAGVGDASKGDLVVKNDPADEAGSGGSSAMDAIRGILQCVGALGQYKCAAAIRCAAQLPAVHRESAYVHGVVGRAYLETGDYVGAAGAFRSALRLDPSRLNGIVEYYSTVLWHMKKETDLAELAIRSFNMDRQTAATWCAVGNCYSSQRDPDMALRYFKRATRVDPFNAYAHTLSGHEYVVKEDFDAALASYRQALVIDDRHYNAWYGIGQVLQKQEKFTLAERHFRAALRIHPENSNLHYHLGVALAASVAARSSSNGGPGGDPARTVSKSSLLPALKELETATVLDRRNPVPKFERAKLLLQMDRLSDARVLLERLRDTLPKEAAVFYELGKVCKRMGDRKTALQCFSNALDLDPKDQGRRYKKAIDTLYSSADGDER